MPARESGVDGWGSVGWAEVASAVWPLVVVVVDVGVEHAPEVCFAEDQYSVEALGAYGADEAPTHPHWGS